MARSTGTWMARAAAGTIVAVLMLGLPTSASAAPPAGKVYVNDVQVVEGNGGTTNALFTISLSPARGTVSVDWSTASGTATSGSDFTSSSGRVTVSKSPSSVQVAVPVIGDTVNEPNETFSVNLSNASGGAIGDAQGIGTIMNDDAAATISVSDVGVAEGNSGPTVAAFAVTLSAPSAQTITVNYATANDTAVAPGDYAAASGGLTFAPGETSKTVNVNVNGDTVDESDEAFRLNLSGATNATIAKAQGVGTITDDDSAQLSVNDASVAEGDAGPTPATFAVTLSVASTQTVTVHWATSDGTAASPADYTAASGNLSFSPGQTSKSVAVPVVGDTTDEPNETFSVDLSSAANAAIADGHGIGTILDDDAAPGLSVSDASVTEGNAGTTTMSFTVSLSAASGKTVTVHDATANDTAVAPGDYAAASGDLTFAPGETTKQVDVILGTDTWFELDETFTLALSAPVNATLTDDTGVGTILNDDALVGVALGDVTVAEGDAGTTSATFDLTLSGPSGLPTTVDWATVDGTATAGLDYTAASGTATFPAGVTTQQVSVDVLGDTIDEPNETFTVSLSNPVNAGLKIAAGTGTITDDDLAVTSLTMTVKKARRTVSAKGLLSPATAGMPVTVTLLKKKGSRYVKVSSRSVQVGSVSDRNGDLILEGLYQARFKRPASGSYRLTASFFGDANSLACSIAKRLKL
jgi:hypothetical protein